MAAFISAPCQIKLHLVWHKNNINQTLVPESGECIDIKQCIGLHIIRDPGTENITIQTNINTD